MEPRLGPLMLSAREGAPRTERCESGRAAVAPIPVFTDTGTPPRPGSVSAANGQFRIVMVAACPMPARRGTPLRVERLAEALAARGHHVELVTYQIGRAHV